MCEEQPLTRRKGVIKSRGVTFAWPLSSTEGRKMAVDKELVRKISDAVMVAAKAILDKVENPTADKVFVVIETIYAALWGVFGDVPGLEPELVAECHAVAEVIRQEIPGL